MDDRHQRRRRRPADPRRRPSDGYRALSAAAFDRLVDEAMRTIPPELLELVENLSVQVADVPPADVMGQGDELLLGLYEGVPRTERGEWLPVLPDVITLYRRPMEARARDRADLATIVRETVVHEIAHHFGIDDDRLDDLGY